MNFSSRIANQDISGIRKALQNAPENSINLALGEIQFKITSKLHTQLLEMIGDLNYCGYTENKGTKELRNEISAYYKRVYSPDCICVTTGAEEAIFITLMSLLGKGDKIALSDPTYPAYKSISEIAEADIEYFKMNKEDFSFSKQNFTEVLEKGIKAILINNPSNPTSKSLSATEISFIIEETKKRNITLIVDEIYLDLAFDSCSGFLQESNDIILISGISKAFAVAGCRLGWVAGPEEFIKKATIMHQYAVSCAPFFSQKIAEFCLKNNDIAEDIKRNLLKHKNTFLDFLNKEGIEFVNPDAAPYILLKVNNNDFTVSENLKNIGILTVPGCCFGDTTKGYIRVNYGIEESLLKVAIDRIRKNKHLLLNF